MESRLRRRTRCGRAGAGIKVHLPVEDQAGLFYNHRENIVTSKACCDKIILYNNISLLLMESLYN